MNNRITNHEQSVGLVGTVPPRLDATDDVVRQMAEAAVSMVKATGAAGLILYDVQEEPSRDGTPRPFPFSPGLPPEVFAAHVHAADPSIEIAAYKMISLVPKQALTTWVETAAANGIHTLTLVGSPVPNPEDEPDKYPGYSVPDAAARIKSIGKGFLLGGIVLPERHRVLGDEHKRIVAKARGGVEFFTSQVIYAADNAIAVLRDLSRECREQGILSPPRLMFTFAPFGREGTARFLSWLGVELPEGTKFRIMSAGSTKEERIEESIRVCRELFKRILEASRTYGYIVPIGFTTESVSRFKDEAKGAERLYAVLEHEMDSYYEAGGKKQRV